VETTAQVVDEPDDGFAKNTSMKNKLSTTILTILIAFAGTGRAESPTGTPDVVAKNAAVIEQVVPVVALLRAVKESDAALFQQCWEEDGRAIPARF
jgi:hypothetical protein